MATSTDPQTTVPMDELLEKSSPSFVTIEPGNVIHGRVIAKDRGKILVDIGGVATGVISGRELTDPFNTAKNIKVGDEISAFVLEDETDEGNIILSLRKAAQMQAWEYFEKIKTDGGTLQVTALEANKGGLIVDANSVRAFLPVSQLAPENYPRVDGANAEEILSKLEKLVGKKFMVKIILLDREINKLVVSEREASSELRRKEMENLKVGDIVDGEINGLVKFGAFMLFGNLEGLIHISELTWSHVKNPTELFKMGDKVTAKVIGIEGHKISLSVKQLQPDPWKDKVAKYKVGSVHKGTINKVTNFGVFVTLEEDVNGLVHTSEFDNEKINPEEEFSEGHEIEVKILEILLDDHSLKLSAKGLGAGGKKKSSKKEEPAEKQTAKESAAEEDDPEKTPEAAEETAASEEKEAASPAKKTTKKTAKKPAAKKTTAKKVTQKKAEK